MKKWPVRPPLAWHHETSRPQSKGLERDGSAVKGTCCSYRKEEDPGLVPSTGMAAHNCLHSSSIYPLPSSTHVVYRQTCMQVTYILKELKTFLFSHSISKVIQQDTSRRKPVLMRLQFYHYKINTLYLSCLLCPRPISLLILHHKSEFF